MILDVVPEHVEERLVLIGASDHILDNNKIGNIPNLTLPKDLNPFLTVDGDLARNIEFKIVIKIKTMKISFSQRCLPLDLG